MHKIVIKILLFLLLAGGVQAQTVKIRGVNKGENNLIQNIVDVSNFPQGGYVLHIVSSNNLRDWETEWLMVFDVPASGQITIGFPVQIKTSNLFWKVELVRQFGAEP